MKNFIILLPLVSAQDNTDFTYKALSDMTHWFETHEKDFDPIYYEKLKTCFNDNDDKLMDSQNAAWTGMYQFFKQNGTDSDYQGNPDHWGQCDDKNRRDICTIDPHTADVVHGPALFGDEEMIIYEPCNYVSNVAYYHSATRICDYPIWSINE